MSNEELLTKISDMFSELKKDLATKEDIKHLKEYLDTVEMKTEIVNARAGRIENAVNKIDDGLVAMQPKIFEISREHTERIERLEEHVGFHRN